MGSKQARMWIGWAFMFLYGGIVNALFGGVSPWKQFAMIVAILPLYFTWVSLSHKLHDYEEHERAGKEKR